MDVTAIAPGSDYSRVIQEKVGTCHVLLAVIGRNWLTMADDSNHRRLDLADDHVRHEIGTALRRNIPVIPLLVLRAEMPSSNLLPPDLAPLALREALEISDGDFDHDIHRLITALERLFGETRLPLPPPPIKTRSSNSCLIWGLVVLFIVIALSFVVGIVIALSGMNQDFESALPQLIEPTHSQGPVRTGSCSRHVTNLHLNRFEVDANGRGYQGSG
jgi:hypothetical protein